MHANRRRPRSLARGRREVPLLAFLLLALVVLGDARGGREPVRDLRGPFPVVEVIDGDTVRVRSDLSRRTIRLIGIDTPEVAHPERGREPFGAEAKGYLRSLLPAGTSVWVEVDLELEDDYGRLLAYLYLPDPDGDWQAGSTSYLQVNERMARAGFASTLEIAPNVQYADLYADAVEAARVEARGMWAPAPEGSSRAGGGAAGAAESAGADRARNGAAAATAGAADAAADVVLACALYDPVGNDTGTEWVTVQVRAPTDTRGMYLHDEGSGSTFPLPRGEQDVGELRIENDGAGVWNNGGDVVTLMRGDTVVDRWDYSGSDRSQGTVVCRP